MKPRLLDLFCGAGGCAVGYARAGFDIYGVDTARQPDYPFTIVRGDALSFVEEFGREFDVIHASPPCKNKTPLRHVTKSRFPTLFNPHPELIGPTLDLLQRIGLPWVIENVPGATELPGPITLCGSMFGLRVRRHRLFASNLPLAQPECRHAEQGPVVGVYGNGGADSGRASRGGGGGVKVAGAEAAEALGIDWTVNQRGLSQAIPPAYTEFIGRLLIEHLQAVA